MKHFFLLTLLSSFSVFLSAQSVSLNNTKIDGYRGIWFTLGQFSEYGDKYSGGLGTYTAKHIPLAIYAPAVDKTFFVYGGTTQSDKKHLLCMIGYYDHKNHRVPKPTVVYDKLGVDDPHDNPSLTIDKMGYLWVFVSGRGQRRPGFKFRSTQPYSIEAFEQITSEEMTYPQPWYIPSKGFLHLFTKYTGVRELYFETSADGKNWTEDIQLAGIKEQSDEQSGHYQVSNRLGDKVVTFFNRHPNGNVDKRTDLYYLQTTDFGKTWTTAAGKPVELPLVEVNNPARVWDYQALGKNVYLKDVNFDASGNPICLYLTSSGHEPGPKNAPYEWKVTFWTGTNWQTQTICESDHNYDMGSLYVDGKRWTVVAPTKPGPQPWAVGGEIELWQSKNQRKDWKEVRQLTQNSPLNHGYVRRPVQAKNPFYAFWADGNPAEFSSSHLYFSDAKGKRIWQLPYEMKEELEEPVRLKK